MKDNMRVTQVAVKGSRIKVKHETAREDAEKADVGMVHSYDAPMDTFKTKMDALKLIAGQMCEIKNAAEWCRNIIIEKIEFTWFVEDGEATIGVKVFGSKPMSKSLNLMKFETPLKYERTALTAEDAKKHCLTEDQTSAFFDMATEAAKYAKGQRSQLTLALKAS